MTASDPHRVVIIGSGFAGLFAARRLKRAPVEVTVIARTSHHLFQPLLYQVATGILSEGEIAPPTRDVLRHQRNTSVLLGEVIDIDLAERKVTSRVIDHEVVRSYDSLIVAAGADTSYFGHDEWALAAPGLKSIDDALALRGRILGAFEMAEIEEDPEVRRAWMTFVVVGGGATGVEMAGQIADLSHHTLRSNYRHIDPADARILLVDALPRLLTQFDSRLSTKAKARLEKIGVEVHLGIRVTDVDEHWVEFSGEDATIGHRVEARTKVWAAGVHGSPLGAILAKSAGLEVARGGRVPVASNCSLPGHPEVFVVGDMMALDDLPGVAEVALQSGRHAASEIIRRVRKGDAPAKPFRYRDLGTLASISRSYAVAEMGPIKAAGLVAWALWLFVHLAFLTGFKNRVSTVFHWLVSFVGRGRAERTITMQQFMARRALPAPVPAPALSPGAGAGVDPAPEPAAPEPATPEPARPERGSDP
ncbi:MAG TPA: NAD(P)/FAD-dependent oxidoreductase [Solirubrobacteraceae bacterium]|nr:NAD(P)/FAD-dependent oxidoreductase [Solirubrobacteraceae bacterium]